MGSSNPVFLLPGALAERGTQIAAGLHASFTLGGGQFCTKPGIVFVPSFAEKSALMAFSSSLRAHTAEGPAFALLTSGIASAYAHTVADRSPLRTATGADPGSGFSAQTALLETAASTFFTDPSVGDEVFGPTTLLVHCASAEQLLQAADSLHGHLTATVHGTEEDLRTHAALLKLLETKVGRIVINSFPTGVEVAHAMVHGGPWPATSDGRSTSVGTQAIYRFTRPVAYQGMPQWALPAELQDPNPLNILRMVNGTYQREAL
jgi:NADP-dependent aldehyde dehydrogenase